MLAKNDPHIRNAARQLHAANYLVIGSDSRAGTKHLGNEAGQRVGHDDARAPEPGP